MAINKSQHEATTKEKDKGVSVQVVDPLFDVTVQNKPEQTEGQAEVFGPERLMDPQQKDKAIKDDAHSEKEAETIPEVNVLAIVVLSQGKCGLSPCITLYLVAMAAADLLAIITNVILHRINDYYFPLNFLSITPVCSVRYVLLRAAIDCSVWFTVSFTFDRFVAICYQKLKTRYCTKKTAAMVLATTGTLLCLKNIPIYFRFKPKVIIDNVPFFCSNKRSYFTDPRWIGFRRFEKVLTPLIPFGLILFLNILTVKHIFKVSRIRKGLKCQNKALDHSDPEMGNRRKSVILLFSISGSFILLWFEAPLILKASLLDKAY
ncbi:uncharacterized protein [Chiloscyllium punctatum]|uniref:uncharacterized protein n=1 Tax=Chiloscyllium punctatum TaxID=137246 RepID=UPI003B634B0E